jgi:hypothetical protein
MIRVEVPVRSDPAAKVKIQGEAAAHWITVALG